MFACVQSIWLIAQSIARVSVGLPITQLELATMALVVCALIMYASWWNKPFGVERMVIVHATYNRDISATVAAFKQAGGPASNIAFSACSTDSSDIYLRAYFKRLLNRGIERGIPKRNLTYDMCVYEYRSLCRGGRQ